MASDISLKVLKSTGVSYLHANSCHKERIIFPKSYGLRWNLHSTFWITAVGCFGKVLLGKS